MTRLLCSTGCGLPVHADEVLGHSWIACVGRGRALDRLLGSAATIEDATCDGCKGATSA